MMKGTSLRVVLTTQWPILMPIVPFDLPRVSIIRGHVRAQLITGA